MLIFAGSPESTRVEKARIPLVNPMYSKNPPASPTATLKCPHNETRLVTSLRGHLKQWDVLGYADSPVIRGASLHRDADASKLSSYDVDWSPSRGAARVTFGVSLRLAILSAGIVLNGLLRLLLRMHWLDHDVVGWPGW